MSWTFHRERDSFRLTPPAVRFFSLLPRPA